MPKALGLFQREFDFFDKVTSISGVLFPLPKEERRAGIRNELVKIEMNGDDLYPPTATNKLVRGIQVDSGIPLQSAAKFPIMITFNVVDKDGDLNDTKPQACIFKSGRLGKLNKRVSFPETLDLSPYMSEAGDDGNVYKLYAMVVHVDMIKASYSGHYLCYTKDFSGNWYMIDGCKAMLHFVYRDALLEDELFASGSCSQKAVHFSSLR